MKKGYPKGDKHAKDTKRWIVILHVTTPTRQKINATRDKACADGDGRTSHDIMTTGAFAVVIVGGSGRISQC